MARPEDPFRQFINSIDFSNFPQQSDSEQLPNGVRKRSHEGENQHFYDLHLSTAHYETMVNTGLDNAHFMMRFPSRLQEFDADDLHEFISRMLTTGYPHTKYTPFADITLNERIIGLDLRNYWDGKRYERALAQNPTSVVYYTDSPNNITVPGSMTEQMPPFIYGFYRTNYDMTELMMISHAKASFIDPAFVAEFLPRNREYKGNNVSADSQNLATMMHSLCKLHPAERLFF